MGSGVLNLRQRRAKRSGRAASRARAGCGCWSALWRFSNCLLLSAPSIRGTVFSTAWQRAVSGDGPCRPPPSSCLPAGFWAFDLTPSMIAYSVRVYNSGNRAGLRGRGGLATGRLGTPRGAAILGRQGLASRGVDGDLRLPTPFAGRICRSDRGEVVRWQLAADFGNRIGVDGLRALPIRFARTPIHYVSTCSHTADGSGIGRPSSFSPSIWN